MAAKPHSGPSSVHVLAPLDELPDITATELKNKFSEVVRQASREPVAITRHRRREFVILTSEHYDEIQRSRAASLADLTDEFDQLVGRMQKPKAKRAANALFVADSLALGKAAKKSLSRAKRG